MEKEINKQTKEKSVIVDDQWNEGEVDMNEETKYEQEETEQPESINKQMEINFNTSLDEVYIYILYSYIM